MRQEFRKQLTKLRKIQDRVMRGENGKGKHNSIEIACYNENTGVRINVSCFRTNDNAAYGCDLLRVMLRQDEPSEKPFEEIYREIQEFMGLTVKQ